MTTNDNLISPNYRSNSIYVTINKECGEYSNKIYQTLTETEKQQMQSYMRQSCKMEDGTTNVQDCELTRRMFNGFYKTH